MPVSQPCADLLLEAVNQVRSFVKSDAGRFFLASLAAARVIAGYLSRSRLSQARELAATVVAAMILAILVVASESPAPGLMVEGLKCNNFEGERSASELALRNRRQTPPD